LAQPSSDLLRDAICCFLDAACDTACHTDYGTALTSGGGTGFDDYHVTVVDLAESSKLDAICKGYQYWGNQGM